MRIGNKRKIVIHRTSTERDGTAVAARRAGACSLEQQERWEGAHPGARASRPHAIPLRAAQFPCDAAPGYPAGGNAMGSFEAESRPRCRSTRVEGMGEALPVLCGRDARAPGWASSRDVVRIRGLSHDALGGAAGGSAWSHCPLQEPMGGERASRAGRAAPFRQPDPPRSLVGTGFRRYGHAWDRPRRSLDVAGER